MTKWCTTNKKENNQKSKNNRQNASRLEHCAGNRFKMLVFCARRKMWRAIMRWVIVWFSSELTNYVQQWDSRGKHHVTPLCCFAPRTVCLNDTGAHCTLRIPQHATLPKTASWETVRYLTVSDELPVISFVEYSAWWRTKQHVSAGERGQRRRRRSPSASEGQEKRMGGRKRGGGGEGGG